MKRRWWYWWLGPGLLLCCTVGQAHPLAPALLELRETAAGEYAVLWRTSVSRAQSVDVMPELPAGCRPLTAPQSQTEGNDALTMRWNVACPKLQGQTVRVIGLAGSGINVILRVEDRQGHVSHALLDASRPHHVVPAPERPTQVVARYLRLGITHLYTGFDHVLFITGLVLLVTGWRPLLWAVTAFTLGHSLTLSLAVLGWVKVNAAVTELGIALSLLYLACEAARPARLDSLFLRYPGLLTMAFGLLHGLGFAGALAGTGLPVGDIPLALLGFNLGIELAQLALIAGLLLMGRGLRQRMSNAAGGSRADGILRVPVYLMGSLAVYWCCERLASLFA